MPANWLPIHSEIKKVLKHNEELILFGGAGSGKTHLNLNIIFKRALALPGSRHICFRKRFEHAKHTTWNSAREHIELEWPGMLSRLRENRSGGTWEIRFPNGSEVLFSGLDDKERIEKHLGSEFATVYINEASEIMNENDIDLISSRLRQKIDGRHMLLLDMNPPVKSHWSYKRYIEDKGKVEGRASFKINPADVKENLPESYIRRLQALPERLRKRFWDGDFLSDVEGALWSYDMILSTRKEQLGNFGRTVVGVDPAVTSKENSDETGIVVVAEKGTGYKVLADFTIKGKPREWAAEVVRAFYDFQADSIVVEVNQGGDLVTEVMESTDDKIPIKQVRATKGKHMRAEPVSMLYEKELVEHEAGLNNLEDQLQSWVPSSGDDSPDRLDALVWAFHELVYADKKPSLSIGYV